MNLFDRLPENFFSVLSSKNKDIYVEAIFVVRKAYRESMIIRKDELVARLISNIEDRMMDIEDEELPEERSLSAIAYFLVKRLKDTGWIDTEYLSNTFEEVVIVYDYSLKVMNLLHDLINISQREYNGYVYNTYSSLKTANEERNDYMYTALKSAYDNTNKLLDELKGLSSEIRNYSRMLVDKNKVHDILVDHFDLFKELVGDRIYYPLKTFDSVPRFKGPIMSIIKSWIYDDDVKEIIINAALRTKVYKEREEANEEIITMMNDILMAYENIDELINEVDRKNTGYTRASEEKIRYLLNTDRSIKGKLVEILKFIQAGGKIAEEIEEEMTLSSNMFEQGYIDENSLYIRNKSEVKGDVDVLEVNLTFDEAALTAEMEDFDERVKKSFSHKRIMEYMESQFRGKESILSSELELIDIEDFVMTIYASLKYDEKGTFYNIDFKNGYLVNGGFRIPCMEFIRKKG